MYANSAVRRHCYNAVRQSGASRALSSTSAVRQPFRLAIVGSGPAGFYTAHKVMQRIPDVAVDMFEQLPVPFGLVRFGVAPDHPEVKNCEDKFTEVATSPNFKFFGNVAIGEDLSLSALRDSYDAIVFAYGASRDRLLGVPGEDSTGIHSARAFVGWYNGLPEYSGLSPDLESSETAVVIGQGNVAMDVTRVLLSDIDRLRNTDITEEALEHLKRSRVKRVHVVGRRGPMQAAFTIKEVRELFQLPNVQFEPIPSEMLPPKDYDLPRAPKRISQLLAKQSAADPNKNATSKFSLDFLLSPARFDASSDNRLTKIDFVRNKWTEGNHPLEARARVTPTDDGHEIEAGLAFRSIGYKSEPLPGMAEVGIDFDTNAGVITNNLGRVMSDGKHVPGLYCAGWVKSGPNGVIASTMEDAFSTAEIIASDWNNQISSRPGAEALKSSLSRSVSWAGWERINAVERNRGAALGKEREKLRSISEMLKVA